MANVLAVVIERVRHTKAERREGGGTTVRTWLSGRLPTQVSVHAEPGDPPRGMGECILVVDDDPAMRAAMVSVLGWLGYGSAEAASVEEAISTLHSKEFSIAVVVTVVVMPGLGGETVAEAVAHRWPAIPVITVSSYPIATTPEPAGCTTGAVIASAPLRLQKPFSCRQFAAAIRAALNGR